jgi:hypothetical protein
LGAALLFGLATAASAAITPAPVSNAGGLIINVAEGCGRGEWRGPHGHCHPMAHEHACPPHHHLGPHGRRCWPD